jgi:hypothetical protein
VKNTLRQTGNGMSNYFVEKVDGNPMNHILHFAPVIRGTMRVENSHRELAL